MVKAPKEVIQEGIQHWDSCLVGQIFFFNPKYSLIYNVANMLWGRDGSVEVMAADKSFWVFKISKQPNQGLGVRRGTLAHCKPDSGSDKMETQYAAHKACSY